MVIPFIKKNNKVKWSSLWFNVATDTPTVFIKKHEYLNSAHKES